MALVEHEGKVLLTRNPEGGLMGGLYELPHGGLPRKAAPMERLRDRYRGTLRIDPEVAVTFRHAITHHRIEARVFRAHLTVRSGLAGSSFHSIPEALALPLGGLTRKALRACGLARG